MEYVSLNTKQLLAQDLHFPGYTSLPSVWYPAWLYRTNLKECGDITDRQLPLAAYLTL